MEAQTEKREYDVIVVGAGAAGLMAAGTAARNGKRVLLLEKMEKSGRKVRITGKGRCNVTNARPAEEFASQVRTNGAFFASAFAGFDNRATIRFFERQGQGHLVAITSAGGLRGSGAAPAYNATKAFQMNYLEGLRQRLAGKRLPVAVTDVRPGFVDTAMAKGEGLFWVAPVEKACRQIVRAIGRRKRVAYVTRRWRIAAWIYRHLPDFLFLRMGG